MMDTWRKFWRKSGYERRIALEAAAALMATWVGLRVAGYRRWRNLLARFTPAGNQQPALRDSTDSKAIENNARVIARMEESAARHLPFESNCLEQSLTLWWLLRRRGIPADLRIGVRKDSGSFEAHAWVEVNGAVLSEAGNQHTHFVPLEGTVPSLETQQN
jgi:hypothetical protein